jgi:hypothetical protein
MASAYVSVILLRNGLLGCHVHLMGQMAAPGNSTNRTWLADGAKLDMARAHQVIVSLQSRHATNEFAGTGVSPVTIRRTVHRRQRRWREAKVAEGATVSLALGGSL